MKEKKRNCDGRNGYNGVLEKPEFDITFITIYIIFTDFDSLMDFNSVLFYNDKYKYI